MAMVDDAGAARANDDGFEENMVAEWRTVAWDEARERCYDSYYPKIVIVRR